MRSLIRTYCKIATNLSYKSCLAMLLLNLILCP